MVLQHEHRGPLRRRPEPRRRVPAGDDRRHPPVPGDRHAGHHRVPRLPGAGRARAHPATHGRVRVRQRPGRSTPTGGSGSCSPPTKPSEPELAGLPWVEVPDDASALVVREYIADRAAETSAALAIEPLDPPSPPPAPTDEALAEQLTGMAWTIAKLATLHRTIKPELLEQPNVLVTAEAADLGAADTTPDNLYMIGTFRLAPDEALVLDIDPPATRYWSVTVENIWHECLDPRRRRSSVTNAAAVAEPDGTVRVVVAGADPGAPTGSTPAVATAGSCCCAGSTTRAPPRCTTRVVPARRPVSDRSTERLDRDRLLERGRRRRRVRRPRRGHLAGGPRPAARRVRARGPPPRARRGDRGRRGRRLPHQPARPSRRGERRTPRSPTGTVERPIVIVGQPRTGTTILYDLLAQDPALRAPLSWEVDHPVPAARHRHLRHRPPHRRDAGPLDMADSLIPGLHRVPPDGRAARPGVRAHHGRATSAA